MRRIDPGEGERLREIRLHALATDPTAFARTHGEELAYERGYWDMRAAGTETSQTFVAVDAGRFVGLVAGFEPAAGKPIELVSMWVAPSARGRGIGRLLVEAVVDWAVTRKPPAVELFVTRGNDAAIELYRSCGFEPTTEVQVSPADPCREELRMRRPMA